MKKKFQEELKRKLEKEKTKLEKTLSSFSSKSKTLPEDWKTRFPQFTEKLEESCEEVEEYLSLLPVEYRLELKFLDVKRALEKIKKGKNYGLCERCGRPIERKRLVILPEAKHCKKCLSFKKS